MDSVGRGQNAGRARYLGNDTEVMLIVLVASDISMSAGEDRGMSMLMEAGDLEEFLCLECATRIAGGKHHRLSERDDGGMQLPECHF